MIALHLFKNMRRKMAEILLVYGDDSQLIEEKKKAFLGKYKEFLTVQLNDENDPATISAELSEDSLFGEAKIFILANIPIFKKSSKSVAPNWDELVNLLLSYHGDYPILITYHDLIDKRIKHNTNILKNIESIECKNLSKDELKTWVAKYCKDNGVVLTSDGQFYISNLIDLWDDVPRSFLKTEFDRLFLQLGEKKTINSEFLKEFATDYGNKNIFAFKDALLERNVGTLLELFPYMLTYKKVNSAIAYIENQLRLQVMVCECKQIGMRERDIVDLCKNYDSSIKPYPIKLAYEKAKIVNLPKLVDLLYGLYEIVRDNRQGKSDMLRFRDLCLTYCEENN